MLHAMYMVTLGVFNTRSAVDPSWRAELRVPYTPYAVSSLFYSAAGIAAICQVLWCPSASSPGWPPAFSLPEAALVFLQGVWSYWSDVVDIGKTSPMHAVDRFSAVSLTFLQVYKFGVVLRPWMTPLDMAWTGVTLVTAVACKMADYHAMQSDDMHLYIRSHFWWHVTLPLGLGSFCLYKWVTAEQCAATAVDATLAATVAAVVGCWVLPLVLLKLTAADKAPAPSKS